MTATNVQGGAAIPVSVTTTRRVKGGAAIPVYGYASAPADGRPAQAGPAIPVRVLTAADLKQNGGTWTLEGRPYAMPIYTAPATTTVMGGPAIAVYPINAWPAPAGVAPAFLSGEVGNVNATTVAVTFNANVTAANYSTGVTIKVNGAGVAISSATRQANHAVVYYVIPAVAYGQTVTWEYSGAGTIAGETGGVAMAAVGAQNITNNVAAWWLSGGIAAANCVAAYQAKGAAALAASYSNLNNPGTNDAALGVAPTFNAATGWTFNGANQYLVAPTVDNGYSVFIQYTGMGVVGTRELFSLYYDSGAADGAWLVQLAGDMETRSGALGANAHNAPELLAGNYGFAGKTPYRNGTAEPNLIAAGAGTGHALFIAATNYNGNPIAYTPVTVQAFVMYNTTITGPQAAALAAAMAAL